MGLLVGNSSANEVGAVLADSYLLSALEGMALDEKERTLANLEENRDRLRELLAHADKNIIAVTDSINSHDAPNPSNSGPIEL